MGYWISIILFPIVIALYYLFCKKNLLDYSKTSIKTGMMHVALGTVSLSVITFLAYRLFDLPSDNISGILAILVMIIIGPINEEIVFRGIIFEFLDKRSKTAIAFLLSSVLFSVAHNGNIYFICLAFIAGLIFCKIYNSTKSIVYPVLTHILVNAISLLFI